MPQSAPRPFRPVVLALGLLLAAHLVLVGLFPIIDFDTWFHLKEGELFVSTRSLPAQDPFAFTTAGREWTKYSWVADVLLYLVDRAAGLPGLVLLRLAMLGVIALGLYRILRNCGLHPVAGVLLVVVASLALRFRLYLRPELFSYPLLLANLALLLRLRERPPWSAYGLLPIQVAWTNVHASFVFGIGIPILVLLANLLPGPRAAPGWDRLRLEPPRRRHLAAAVALLPLAVAINPNGLGMLLFPFRQNNMERLTAFAEWKEVWFLPQAAPEGWEPLIVLGVVLLAFTAMALLLWRWDGRWDPVGWGIVLSMGSYAVLRNRAVPYFVLAVLPLLGLALIRLAAHMPARVPARTPGWFAGIGAAAGGLLLMASIAAQLWSGRELRHTLGVRPGLFPEAACAFLERYRVDGRVFNTYEVGGYLIWRRWPANQVIIDGRYDAVLFSQDLFAEYEEAYRSPTGLDRLTAAYGVEILVVNANPRYRRIPHLRDDPRWALVYWDKVAEVYLRRGGRYAALIAAREYRLTRSEPDLSYLAAYRKDPALRARALAELQRAVEDNPENAWAWLGLAQEYRAAGPAALEDHLNALTAVLALLPGEPTTSPLYADKAEALLELGRADEAASAARQALSLNGRLLKPHWILALAAERRGAWAEARDHLHAILRRLEPDHPEGPVIRARLNAAERALGGGARR